MNAKTQSDRMFDRLQADILACRIAPGSKLRINDIAESSEVSLGAVREALSRLGAEGLVMAESQKGYHVAQVSVEDLYDLTEARIEIERIALSRSIARGDLKWETSLVAAWHRLSRIPQPRLEDPDAHRWVAAHAEFHQALAKDRQLPSWRALWGKVCIWVRSCLLRSETSPGRCGERRKRHLRSDAPAVWAQQR